MIQGVLWEETLLHIARLTDRSTSPGRRQNPTIQNLAQLIDDPDTRATVTVLVDTAVMESKFCRDWRNRHIAHRDLDLATNKSASPLERASRMQVKQVLKAITDTLHAVEDHYTGSETHFEGVHQAGGAVSLLYVIDEGIRAQAERKERRRRGDASGSDYRPAPMRWRDDVPCHQRRIVWPTCPKGGLALLTEVSGALAGLEPALAEPDFESGASTNSATGAGGRIIVGGGVGSTFVSWFHHNDLVVSMGRGAAEFAAPAVQLTRSNAPSWIP